MFLVEDRRLGIGRLVFTYEDPRKDGYLGPVEADVTLDYDMERVHRWPDGAGAPEVCVGRAPGDAKAYKVFGRADQLLAEGYRRVEGEPVVFGSWAAYARLWPTPDRLTDEQWLDHLDEVDEEARRRARRSDAPDEPASAARDDVASWVARKHLLVDSGVREVWYLPQGAPADEIRLIEVNDRVGGVAGKAAALDFGLAVEGAAYRLCVADVSREQLGRIRQDPSLLPAGWDLADAVVRGRRG